MIARGCGAVAAARVARATVPAMGSTGTARRGWFIEVSNFAQIAQSKLSLGDLTLLVAFGAGLTYGSALIRW